MKELSTEFKLVNDWMINVEKYLFWLHGRYSDAGIMDVAGVNRGLSGYWRARSTNSSLKFRIEIKHECCRGRDITIYGDEVFEYSGLSPDKLFDLGLGDEEYVNLVSEEILKRWVDLKVGRCSVCESSRINLDRTNGDICRPCSRAGDKKTQAGYVYMFGSREFELYKIGCSVTPVKRKKLWDSSMPFELEMIHMFFTDDKYKEEKRIHDMFSEFSLQREWFKLSSDQVAQFEAIA